MKADVVVVLRGAAQAFSVVGEICGRDGVVHSINGDLGVIEATVGCEHVGALHKLSGVTYVRPVMMFAESA
jgi:hypothetical protein